MSFIAINNFLSYSQVSKEFTSVCANLPSDGEAVNSVIPALEIVKYSFGLTKWNAQTSNS